jgi:hypothetical protein
VLAAACELLLHPLPTDAILRDLCARYEIERAALTRAADRMRAQLTRPHDTPRNAMRVALEHPDLLAQVSAALPPDDLFAALQILASAIDYRCGAIAPTHMPEDTLELLLELPATDEVWECCSATLRTDDDELVICNQCYQLGPNSGLIQATFTHDAAHPSACHKDLIVCILIAMLSSERHGEPRRPRRIVCADPIFVHYAAAALRCAEVELVLAPLSGPLGIILQVQHNHVALPPILTFKSFAHAHPGVLPELFERCAQLFEQLDWDHADPALAMELSVRAPPHAARHAIVALSGRAQSTRGIWVFHDARSWEQWLAAGPERWLAKPLSSYVAVTFSPAGALLDELRKQIMALNLPIAAPDAYPCLHDARASYTEQLSMNGEQISGDINVWLMSALYALEAMTHQAPDLLRGPLPHGRRLLRTKRPASDALPLNLSLRAPHPEAARSWWRLGLHNLAWQP